MKNNGYIVGDLTVTMCHLWLSFNYCRYICIWRLHT